MALARSKDKLLFISNVPSELVWPTTQHFMVRLPFKYLTISEIAN